MWYQVLIPAPVLLIPVLVMTTKCQAPKNNSDVIVTYSNHAEADNVHDKILAPIETRTDTVATIPSTVKELEYAYEYSTRTPRIKVPVTESSDVDEPIQDDVIFLPNDRGLERNEDFLEHEGMSYGQMMGHKTVGDILGKKATLTTEAVQQDIIFVAGKNNENEEKPDKERLSKKGTYVDAPYGEIETVRPKLVTKLDCKNLDCNNTVESICGAKVENKKWRYRLFMNDCYFRKVNCNFRNADNRFKLVGIDYCNNVGAHQSERPSLNTMNKFDVKPIQVDNTRRSGSARRSMSMSVDGHFCSHPCPTTCPDDYEPDCAVTGTGQYRIFLNHCKLDLNSCSYGVLWRRRPLAECVGGKKADMRQNRGFIDWMQRVGIVDKKGRLVLS